jgi:hypothetical protein
LYIYIYIYIFFFFAVLGLELRAFTFSHLTSTTHIGGLWSNTDLGKCAKPYLRKKLKAKGLGAWFKW